MALTQKRIDAIFGSDAATDAPTTATGSALARIAKLDAAMAELADENREGGESRASAYAKMLAEQPALYDRYEARKRQIMAEHGFDGGAE